MPENKPLTGYPSIDKPWLKYYAEDKRSFTLPDLLLCEDTNSYYMTDGKGNFYIVDVGGGRKMIAAEDVRIINS